MISFFEKATVVAKFVIAMLGAFWAIRKAIRVAARWMHKKNENHRR